MMQTRWHLPTPTARPASPMGEFDDLIAAPDDSGLLDLSHRAWVTLDDAIWTWGTTLFALHVRMVGVFCYESSETIHVFSDLTFRSQVGAAWWCSGAAHDRTRFVMVNKLFLIP